MNEGSSYVGIDVSKDTLGVAERPIRLGGEWVVPNNGEGVAHLVSGLADLSPTLVVLEATGGLEVPVAGALARLGGLGCPWQ